MSEAERYEVRFEPDGVAIDVPGGANLPFAAVQAGLPMELPCGGMGQCGQCRVEVIRGIRPPTPDEERCLTANQLKSGVRLACRQKVTRDLTVTLGDQVRSRANQIMVGGESRAVQLDAGVERLVLPLGKAPLGDERDDWTRLEQLAGRPLRPSLAALRQLPTALAAETGEVTATLVDDRVVRLEAGAVARPPLGYAVDIGTTTVVLYLLDLTSGAELAHAAMLNPQVAYGDDVIARIHHAGVEAKGVETLHREIRVALDQLLRQACEQAGRSPSDVFRGTIVGNATMTHLFCGLNPRGLGIAPFAPVTHESVTAPASEFGLRAAAEATVTVLPNIAGFLGSDTVGVLLAVMAQPEQTCLAVDIGTNGEMVLYHNGQWWGCSAAAGPAFEGARIGCGMRGAAGAICRIDVVDEQLNLAVIDEVAPRGLCGSGLLDAIAVLLEAGVLDDTGRFDEADHDAGLGARLSGDGPRRRFRLASAAESATGDALYLTAGDIREVQLAKSSIRASIEALLARAGVGYDDVQKVYLAGGFGSFLRVPSAVRIGLLPPFPPDRIKAVGNAAGAGARLALISRAELQRAAELARQIDVLYLASDLVYQMQFMEQMVFPGG
ncbi:MAG: DUF4445 domain-containing protein [Fimbriimonadaceae bacterium]|nr:DUF4445 domain-containing protein [Fimbriimonadaceae bacterium]